MLNKFVATVIFVHDLDTCQAFYRDTLKLQLQESDTDSVSFLVGDQYFILLKIAAAADLLGWEVDALKVAGGPRRLLAAGVTDVDTVYAELAAKGATLIRPPTNQHWGLRTAHFADPEGNVWEINQPIAAKTAE